MRDPGRNTWTFYEPAADGSDLLPPAPFDALTDPGVEDLLPAGLSLWPRGAAWGTPDGQAAGTDTVLAGFTRALLSPFADLYRRAWLLTQESRALTLVDSLPDWEADYGLPDACSPDPAEAARRRALLTRVRAVATITPQDFIQLARQEGFDIAIEEPALFECGFSECGGAHTMGDRLQEVYWIVHVYGLAVDYFRCGESECGHDPLFAVAEVERLQCLFARLAPGWTQPVYVVHEQTGAEGLLESFESGLAFDFIDETYAIRVEGEPDLSATGPWHQAPGLSFSRGSSAYRTNASGVMESVASGVLRFDHDPVAFAPKGALIEGSRVNLVKNNSMQGASAGVRPTGWTVPFTNATGITIAPVGSGVEDGIDYSDWDITGTASVDGTVFLYCWGSVPDIPASPGQVYSGSLFCKVAAGSLAGTTWIGGSGVNGIYMSPYDASSAGITGAQSTAFSPNSAPLAQCRYASENWTTPSNTAYIGMYIRFQVTAGIPINLRLRIGWPQIEQAANASSPIRTTTATVTRAADSLSVGIAAYPEGTMFVEALTSLLPITGVNGLIQIDDGTTGNRISLYQLSNTNRRVAALISSGGVASINASYGTAIAAGGTVKTAISWSGTSGAISINGGAATALSGLVVPSVNSLRIGGSGGGVSGNPWGGPISRALLLPRALSPAELQALSA